MERTTCYREQKKSLQNVGIGNRVHLVIFMETVILFTAYYVYIVQLLL